MNHKKIYKTLKKKKKKQSEGNCSGHIQSLAKKLSKHNNKLLQLCSTRADSHFTYYRNIFNNISFESSLWN